MTDSKYTRLSLATEALNTANELLDEHPDDPVVQSIWRKAADEQRAAEMDYLEPDEVRL